jgi:hypothetical protein
MRVLIYKRTHPGDPNADGVFGCEDCMGAVRGRRFDAVIGVGGKGAESQYWGLNRRLNWVGVGAHPSQSVPVGHRGPLLTFDRFVLFEDRGPPLKDIAPTLARHLYNVNRRVVMSEALSPKLQREIRAILALASRKSKVPRRERGKRVLSKSMCAPTVCPPDICVPDGGGRERRTRDIKRPVIMARLKRN